MTPAISRAITLLFLSGTLGCGAVKRVHQCQAVVQIVNEGLAELELQVPDAGESASAYAAIAAGYEALDRRLDALAPGDSSLAKAIESYREVAQRAAKSSRAYSEALSERAGSSKQRADKQARLNRIRAEAQSDTAREALVVRKLNSVCHPQ